MKLDNKFDYAQGPSEIDVEKGSPLLMKSIAREIPLFFKNNTLRERPLF